MRMRGVAWVVGMMLATASGLGAAEPATKCDAAAILSSVTTNLRGPAGKMGVATGTLTLGHEVKNVKLAYYVAPNGSEAFQGEDRGSNDEFLKKIRLIRTAADRATTLVLVPSMRQGRKMRFVPTHPLFGSGEIHHYLLLPTSALERDYSFRCEATGDGGAVLEGTRNEGAAFAPYPGVRLLVRPRGTVWVVESAECQGTSEFAGFTETFADYKQLPSGGWAPAAIEVNGVRLRLDWRVEPVPDWIVSDNTTLLDQQDIP